MPDETTQFLNNTSPWFLVFAHPGHELRAYHFMERVRPTVAVITDGSGSTSASRLDDSRALLDRAHARPADTFGPLTDREAYAALMAADARPFVRIVDRLADALLAEGVQAVLVDAAEGYNPVHDVCHWLGRAAVRRAREFGAEIALFELDLIAAPNPPGNGLRLVLDERAFARKLDATSGYVALKAEADAAFERYGQDAFRVEFLRRVTDGPPPPSSWIPYYEEVGEARVRTGVYTSVLRYGTHVRPVVQRLLESVQTPRDAADFRTLNQ
jgi:hypothetical protein